MGPFFGGGGGGGSACQTCIMDTETVFPFTLAARLENSLQQVLLSSGKSQRSFRERKICLEKTKCRKEEVMFSSIIISFSILQKQAKKSTMTRIKIWKLDFEYSYNKVCCCFLVILQWLLLGFLFVFFVLCFVWGLFLFCFFKQIIFSLLFYNLWQSLEAPTKFCHYCC